MPDETKPNDASNVDDLERLARAATPGDWEAECIEDLSGPFFHCPGSEQVFRAGWDVRGPLNLGNYESSAFAEEDAVYIAAVQPKNVLALVARVRELEAERDALRTLLREADLFLTRHHSSGIMRDEFDSCPVCNTPGDYPNNIFARIERALAAGPAAEKEKA